MSGRLQGLILGLILFSIIINSQDDGMEHTLSKSVDDTKLWWWAVVTILDVRATVQRDFNNSRKWTDKNLMKPNTDLYLKQNKLIQQHRLGTNCLRSSSVEKYWGLWCATGCTAASRTPWQR